MGIGQSYHALSLTFMIMSKDLLSVFIWKEGKKPLEMGENSNPFSH